jgi:hypothetical protein
MGCLKGPPPIHLTVYRQMEIREQKGVQTHIFTSYVRTYIFEIIFYMSAESSMTKTTALTDAPVFIS